MHTSRSGGRLFLCGLLAAACGGGAGARARDGGPLTDAPAHMDSTAVVDAPRAAADGGDPRWPDAGALPPPEWAALAVGGRGSCPPTASCGGAIAGAWDVAGGCFEVDVEGALAACPGATVTRREGRGRGRVVFGADALGHRVAQAVVEVAFVVPAPCLAAVSCDAIAGAVAPLVTEARCGLAAGGHCACEAMLRVELDQRAAYRVDGDAIVAVGTDRRWAFCVDGDRLRYWDTSPSGPLEPGRVELRRR